MMSPSPVAYIQIKLQDGPIRLVGVNGAQIDEVIAWCRDRLLEFNAEPHFTPETAIAISDLNAALAWLQIRTRDRERRGVEGTSAP